MSAKPIYGVGVDAGSAWTRTVICLLERDRIRLLGYGEVPSQGWTKSVIADQKAVADCILRATREAERCAQAQVDAAVLGTGGSTVGCGTRRGGYEFGYAHEFEQADVNRVIERAAHVELQEDRMLLHLGLLYFSVDGRPGHHNPRGTVGSHLEAYVNLVTFSIQEHHSLVGAAHQAYLAVEETVFEPIAAAYAALLPEQRREGIAVVDIGAHSTDLVVYYGDALLLASSLRVCGDHFTKDAARGLGISFDDAEWVKVQHGCALVGLTAGNSIIELPAPPGRKPRETSRRRLNLILEARARELFEHVQGELGRVRLEDGLMGGVVLCGGMARLPGMCDVAEQVLNCQASWGLPTGIQDWPAAIHDPSWTTAAGLAMYSARLKQRSLEGGARTVLRKVFG